MHQMLEFGLFCFTSLFTMVNPLGVIPVYSAMSAGLSEPRKHQIARKATITAALIMIMFALTGQLIFNFFSITADSLRIVGGVIFFIMGYDMLQAHLSRTQEIEKNEIEYAEDIAITPLAIPLICGPGAITSVIVLMDTARTAAERGLLLVIILLIMLITYLVLISGQKIVGFLGENGNKVMLRLMGLIVMVIAVEFFFAGLRPILRDILKIS